MAVFGVWMWPQTIRLFGAEKVISIFSRAGITDIYFLVKGLMGETAYPSDFAPSMTDRDMLGELLCAAHSKGIRVHAWFTSACDAHYKERFPESGRCHYARGKDRELISLADEGYLAYMKDIVSEVCMKYEIDGLHLDYIRYNHLLYGWAEEDIRRYAAEGADIDHLRSLMHKTFYAESEKDPNCIFDAFRSGDPSVHAFVRTRRRDVVRFAEALICAAHAKKPDLLISAALMPEGAYDDIAFSDLHYGQNYSDAAHLYDAVLPMAYSKAYHEGGQWVRNVAEGTLRRGLRTVMGLHAYEGGTSASLQEDILSLDGTSIDGICLFRAGSFAFAFCGQQQFTLYNITDKPITKLIVSHNKNEAILNEVIKPGSERRMLVPFNPEMIRAFSDEKEICVFQAAE